MFTSSGSIVLHIVHPPHCIFLVTWSWTRRLPLVPCYWSNPEAKTFKYNPIWNSEHFPQVHTQEWNYWTEAMYEHNCPVSYHCFQYSFTSLYSQQRYIKVAIEKSFHFSSWVIDGEKEGLANLILELYFKENEHGTDNINVSFLWFLAMYTFDISMCPQYKSTEMAVNWEQSMQISTFP